MADNNTTYQKINWGWLNDYNGYKFAPITFVDQLYTKNGQPFRKEYEQQWEDLRNGNIVAKKALTLVHPETFIPYTSGMIYEKDDNNIINEYNTFSEYQPIYFKDGIPNNCNDNIISGIYGNVNVIPQEQFIPVANITRDSYNADKKNNIFYYIKDVNGDFIQETESSIFNSKTVYYILNETYNKNNTKDTVIKLLQQKNDYLNIILAHDSTDRQLLDESIIAYNNIQQELIKLTEINGNTINGNTINGNTINGNAINGNKSITSPIFYGDITFNTPLTLTWFGDASGSTQYIGNQGFNVELTLKDSGVSANTYGPNADAVLKHEDTFTVPNFKVDAKGLVTAAGTITYTLPEGNKVSISQVSDEEIAEKTKRYILTNSATGDEATNNVLKYYSDIYIDYDETDPEKKIPVLMGAAWNDYAEFRDQIEIIEPGYCVASADNGKVYKTTEKLQTCDGIVSDTYGFAIGKSKTYQTPLAVSGRVLAYCEGDRKNYHSGDVVCAGPEGKVIKMTREEIKEYPDKIVGIVSEIPEYDEWSGKKVNNRIWIKIK